MQLILIQIFKLMSRSSSKLSKGNSKKLKVAEHFSEVIFIKKKRFTCWADQVWKGDGKSTSKLTIDNGDIGRSESKQMIRLWMEHINSEDNSQSHQQ